MSENMSVREAQGDSVSGLLVSSPVECLWRGASAPSPERELALEMIRQAAHDLRHFRGARVGKSRRLYNDAHNWVRSRDDAWPFSFENLCAALGLSAAALRATLLRDPP